MKTYRVAPLPIEAEGWTVIRSMSGAADEFLGQYLDRAEAQSECARLVAEEAELQGGHSDSSDTTYHVFEDAGVLKVRILRLGSFVQEADGFTSRADAESWIAQAKRLGAIRSGQQTPIELPHLKVVKP